MIFKNFQQAVSKRFAEMSKHDLFRVDLDVNKLWEQYLVAFPAGSDPIYRKKTEHDCSCCKNFIRNMGNVVMIDTNGDIQTIWNVTIKGEPEYQAVTDALNAFVKQHKICDAFLIDAKEVGAIRTFERMASGDVSEWNHFHVDIPAKFVKKRDAIPTLLNQIRTPVQTYLRALTEFTVDDVTSVLELIAQNSIYRGAEHKHTLESFLTEKRKFEKTKMDKETYVWSVIPNVPGYVSGIRSSSIGQLLVNLSKGETLEDSVKAFEAMVAGPNYKRPTALVTKKMVETAKNTIEELGLTSSLERRYATLSDITINNLLFANRSTKNALGGDVFDDIISQTKTAPKNFDQVTEVSMDKFISDILPNAKQVELMLENHHVSNFVSLVAPEHATSQNLFKWDNKFSWSYTGDLADSIKERVKAAGGNVTGDVCCRLAWYNHDDLDFHMKEPSGHEVYFGNRSYKSPSGGRLDVDMNAGYGQTKEPVENIFYDNAKHMRDGKYKLFVENFSKRDTDCPGFDVEIDIKGVVYSFSKPNNGSNKQKMPVATLIVKNGVVTVEGNLESKKSSKTVWGVKTNEFVNVNAAMLSPNYWDEKGVGNKHYFFMLEGCQNEGVARGFYNEFLRPDLDKHRKVMEMVGSKMKTEQSASQLSGVGFSSTKKDSFVVRVTGATTRVLKVVI